MNKQILKIIAACLFGLPMLASCGQSKCEHTHTHIEGAVEATCVVGGKTGNLICNDCNEIITPSRDTNPLGHDFKEKTFIEPTPDTPGRTVEIYCSRCGYIKQEAQPIPITKIEINKDHSLLFDDSHNGTFSYLEYSLLASNVYKKSNYAFEIKHNGLIINEKPFLNISKIHISAEGDTSNLFLYLGDWVMPYLNPTQVSTQTEYSDIEANYFTLSYNGNSSVSIKELAISYKYCPDPSILEEDQLPVVNIVTEEETDGFHKPITTKTNYVNSEISITSFTDHSTDIEKAVAGVKLRGNSTLGAPKKAYRIKFDKKQSVFGLTKAKSWVLLAEYFDGSSLHNYIVQKMVSHLDGFIYPFHTTHVNLVLNGENLGLYILCEQPDEKEGRVNNEMDIELDTKFEDISFVLEHDEMIGRVEDPTNVLDKTYFKFTTSDGWTRYYDITYPEIDAFPDYNKKKDTSEMFSRWIDYLRDYVKSAYEAIISNKKDEIEKYIDINSLFQMCVIDDFVDECDHNHTSFKIHRDGNSKIFVGPCWDYDTVSFGFRCINKPYDDPFNETEPFSRNLRSPWLAASYRNSKLKKEFFPYYKQYLLNNIETIKEELRLEAKLIGKDLIGNARLWQNSNLVIPFENIRYLNYYINNRYETLMNGDLKNY